MAVHRPDSGEALAEVVADCVEARRPMAIRGAGTTDIVIDADAVIDVAAHRGIVDYDPDELVVTARSGTPLAEIEALLAARQQMLAFDPVDPKAIGGGAPGGATIGGVVASGNAGPRRVSAGAARDHLLGFTAVSGRGEAFKAGGRVVKNVTGFDLAKLFAGSWGTLGVLDTVTLRVLPAPRFEATLIVPCDCGEAGRIMAAALRHAVAVSCAAWCDGRALLRIDGFRPSVDARFDQLARMVDRPGVERADGAESARLWNGVRTVAAIATTAALWRVGLPTMRGAAFAEAMTGEGFRVLIDWGGARVWLGGNDDGDGRASVIHQRAAASGGHARLVRASPAVRAHAAPPPPDAATAMLLRRLREAFDPHALFNPGLDPWER
ncbi:MAG TPA: glycolate oxidase subunit GlcE [Sphingomonas sp.]|nr:glycolate oxidase subunit GlcE [Sphingomonas sp.]